jgi:ligand-binding sensor domain-containing protein
MPSRRRPVAASVAALLAAAATGCPPPAPPVGPAPPRGTVRIRVITDASPVQHLVAADGQVFAAGVGGLDRWDVRTGEVLSLSATHGLPGDRVLALAADEGRRWLWVATDGGLGLYDLRRDTFTEVPQPAKPREKGAADPLAPLRTTLAGGTADRGGAAGLAMAPAVDGGVWLGHPAGLFYAEPAGSWQAVGVDQAVVALAGTDDGWLWIGGAAGMLARSPVGELAPVPELAGALASVRLLARFAGGVLAVGDDADGDQRIAVRSGSAWSVHKLSPEVRLDELASDGAAVLARAGGRLYRFAPAQSSGSRTLSRDGVALLPLAGGAGAPLAVVELAAELPAEPTAVTALGGEVFVGTRDVGIARWKADAAPPAGWLRRGQLVANASTLSVACRRLDDCWVATGTRRAWRFDGEAFTPTGPSDQAVLAVVRRDDGRVFALHRAGDARAMELSEIAADGTRWTPTGIRLETPGARAEASFAEFSPTGVLWVGLRYQEDGEERPFGVALVDVDLGVAVYHRETASKKERQQGLLPVPIDVVDGAFQDDDVWLATTEGAARLVGEEITVWSEATGMASELVRAVASASGGMVYAGTGAGVGAFDGERWTFPRELSFEVNDLALAPDGRLWMATDRGIALYDGSKVRRLDVRRGLLENEVLDVVVDDHGRVWARGAGSLTVVAP